MEMWDEYDDMVRAQYRLLREGLGVDHLRLVIGTSMGGMHTWMWGEMYPDSMDALMPLASAPVEIAGRNRIFRRVVIDSIRSDPEWKDGEYTTPPRGLIAARAAGGHQLGGRRGESAGTGHPGARDPARAQGALHPHSYKPADAGSRHPLAARGMEAAPGGTARGHGAVASCGGSPFPAG